MTSTSICCIRPFRRGVLLPFFHGLVVCTNPWPAYGHPIVYHRKLNRCVTSEITTPKHTSLVKHAHAPSIRASHPTSCTWDRPIALQTHCTLCFSGSPFLSAVSGLSTPAESTCFPRISRLSRGNPRRALRPSPLSSIRYTSFFLSLSGLH